MTPKPILYARIAAYLMAWWISIIVATAQNDSCEQATPFEYFDCVDFDPSVTQEATLCYVFVTGGSSVDFNFGYFAFCSDLSVEYTLHNCLCDSITTNDSGEFDIAPDVCYIVCGTVTCGTPGGIREICTTEILSLPVELSGFVAYPTDAGVVLSWETASEHGSDRFEVFRMRTELDRGTLLTSLRAAGYSLGETSYRWTDTGPEVGMRFYRLEGVDLDGSRRILSILPVTWQRGNDGGKLWPLGGDTDAGGRRVR